MEFIADTHKYGLHDYYSIMEMGNRFDLPNYLKSLLRDIDKEIIPIVVEKNPEKQYKQKHEHHHKSKKPSNSKKEDLGWENIRNFKTTKIEKKEGKEKTFNDIRICLNKMSIKNYDTQRDTIFQLLNDLKQTDSDSENSDEIKENDKDKDKDKDKESKSQPSIQKIAESIFDIASTNMFYAEIYARFYKELIQYDPIFNDILTSLLSNYANSIKEIKYVNPDQDYEGYCMYNKKNDMRKATAVFIIHLMNQGIVAVLKVLSLIVSFQEMAIQYVEEDNRINEVEEIAEVLYLFLDKGINTFSNCKAEWIWKFMITKHIQTFAKYKKNDKKSISSRAIFKYMDMATLIDKVQD